MELDKDLVIRLMTQEIKVITSQLEHANKEVEAMREKGLMRPPPVVIKAINSFGLPSGPQENPIDTIAFYKPALIVCLKETDIRSGDNPMLYAERLIKQLPMNHDGRNTWLLNHGVSEEAFELRKDYEKENECAPLAFTTYKVIK